MSRRFLFQFVALGTAAIVAGCSDSPTSPPSRTTSPTAWQVDVYGGSFTSIWGAWPTALHLASGPATFTYDGSTWRSHSTGGRLPVTDLWGTAVHNVYATTVDGRVLHFVGTAWSPSTSAPVPLYAIWGGGPEDIYAAGDAGTILHYDGTDWTPVAGGVTWRLDEIWGSGPNDIYILSHESKLTTGPGSYLHFDGTDWRTATLPASHGIRAVWGSMGTVYMTDNQGILFSGSDTLLAPVTPPLGVAIDDIAGLRSGVIYGSTPHTIYTLRGTAPGTSSDEVISGLWSAPWGSVYAVGSSGLVLETTGSDWTPVREATPPVNLYTVFGSSWSDIYALGDQSQGFHFDGHDWTPASLPSGSRSLAGTALSSSFAVVVGDGPIEMWDGAEWHATENPTPELDAVYAAAPNDVFAAGIGDIIVHYDGVQWSRSFPPAASAANASSAVQGWLYGIHGSGGHNVYACGLDGEMLHFDGTSWTPMATPAVRTLRSVWTFAPDNVFAVGDFGTVVHYDGTQWTTIRVGTIRDLWSIWAYDPEDIFVMDVTGTMLHYDGREWSLVTSPAMQNAWALWGTPAGRLYATGSASTVMSIRTR